MNLQQRVLALVLVLLLLVLGGTIAVVSRETYRHSLERARDEVSHSRFVLLERIDALDRQLRDAAGVLAKDDALRQALFDLGADPSSIRLALDNHRRRLGADRATLIDLSGAILADTSEPGLEGRPFAWPELLVEEAGEAVDGKRRKLARTGRRLEALVAVPYYVPVSAPRPSFWLALGRELEDDWAAGLEALAGAEISLVGESGGRIELLATSHGASGRAALAAAPLPSSDTASARILAGEEYIALAVRFPGDIVAILDRPTAPTRLDTSKLVARFAWIAVVAAALAVVGAWLLARRVSLPLRTLEAAARRFAAGEYATELPLDEPGEVGILAREFAAMERAVGEREAAIERLAFRDELTGLPNRNRFREELAKRLGEAERAHGRLAVLLVDVDRFHEINDALGHHVGDRLLLALAERLVEVARTRSLHVSRLGGDEFVLIAAPSGVTALRETVTDVQRSLNTSFEIEDARVELSASVGVALFPEHGGDPATLLRRAEVAMYAAKEGRRGAAFYDSALDRDSVERLSLAADLRRAIEDDRLELVFQPKLDIAEGRVHEVEVLLRWAHERRGEVPIQEAIAVAERTGLIRDVTAWVLDSALEQGAAWRRAGLDLTLAVNLSALDLLDAELAGALASRLARVGFPPQRLVLEITETGVMADPASARRVLDELTAMGVRISIDDFGTGFSSLAQLQRLPVRELKVDRSFIAEMARSSEVWQIVRSTIDLGHGLGLRVVAEGVESRETLEELRGLGCDVAQGFFVSAPLRAPELVAWLGERSAAKGSAA
jgi:diguanylate cyclase (GGDEF)-like protein